MGIYSDWVVRNPGQSDKQVVNVEGLLKTLDRLLEMNIAITGTWYVPTPPLPPS